jgi:hypothetical protein
LFIASVVLLVVIAITVNVYPSFGLPG